MSGIAADAAGNAYVTGSTFDDAFPATAGAFQTKRAGGTDAFAAKLNPQGSAMVWASYLGGKGDDAAHAIAVDSKGNVWLSGTTASADFPNQQGWSQGGDFVAGLNAAGSALTYSSRLPDDTAAASLAVDAAGTLHFAGYGGLVSTISPTAALAPRIFGITNSAFGPAGGRITGGEVISIYGPHIGPAAPVTAVPDASGMMPRSLGGVQVSINGSPVPLLYVSDSQVNAVTPLLHFGHHGARAVSASTAWTTADFVATRGGGDSGNLPARRRHGGGRQSGWQHQLAGASGATGKHRCHLGDGNRVDAFRRRAGWPHRYERGGLRLLRDLGARAPANVLYGGAAPGIVAGVVQVNFQVPAQFELYVTLTASGATSHPVQIYVVPQVTAARVPF